MPSNPAIPHRCGKATPQRRDESACNKTATQVRSRKSLQKTETDGRSVERAIRYHGHVGLSGHKRELLIRGKLHDGAFATPICRIAILERGTGTARIGGR